MLANFSAGFTVGDLTTTKGSGFNGLEMMHREGITSASFTLRDREKVRAVSHPKPPLIHLSILEEIYS